MYIKPFIKKINLIRSIKLHTYLMKNNPKVFYENIKTNSNQILCDLAVDQLNTSPDENVSQHSFRFMSEHLEIFFFSIFGKIFLDNIFYFFINNKTNDVIDT